MNPAINNGEARSLYSHPSLSFLDGSKEMLSNMLFMFAIYSKVGGALSVYSYNTPLVVGKKYFGSENNAFLKDNFAFKCLTNGNLEIMVDVRSWK